MIQKPQLWKWIKIIVITSIRHLSLTRRSEFPTKIGRVSDSLMKVHLDYASTISRSFDENDNVVDEHSWSQKHITQRHVRLSGYLVGRCPSLDTRCKSLQLAVTVIWSVWSSLSHNHANYYRKYDCTWRNTTRCEIKAILELSEDFENYRSKVFEVVKFW